MSGKLVKFSQLTENKQKAVKMRAEGITIEAIASDLGTPFRTVQDWVLPSGTCVEELSEYKAYLADQQIASSEDLQKRAAKDAVAVWEKLLRLSLSDDPTIPSHVILGAMDSVLDRAGIARVSKTEGKLGLTVTEEDRRKRWDEIRNLQSQIEPVQLKQLAGGKT